MGAQLVRDLHARGHEIVMIAGPHLPGESDPQSFFGIPVYRFPFEYVRNPFTPEMVIKIKKRLAALVQDFRPDIFHFYQTTQGFFLHLSSARRGAAPTLLTIHSNYFDAPSSVNQARRQLVQQVDWTNACSQNTLDDTRKHVPEIATRSSVIHNALTMPDREPTPLDFDAPRILCLGRLHPVKRVDIAIAAFARIRDRFPRARLLVAGDGTEEPSLRAQVAHLGMQSVVDFLGWVAPPKVPELLNQTTVMLVPSKVEAFGLVALQAGQMARPVIGTRAGGMPEMVIDGETGILVEPENAEAMADALATLLTQPDRARALGMAAREHVQQKFGWRPFVDQYEALYTQLITQRLMQKEVNA